MKLGVFLFIAALTAFTHCELSQESKDEYTQLFAKYTKDDLIKVALCFERLHRYSNNLYKIRGGLKTIIHSIEHKADIVYEIVHLIDIDSDLLDQLGLADICLSHNEESVNNSLSSTSRKQIDIFAQNAEHYAAFHLQKLEENNASDYLSIAELLSDDMAANYATSFIEQFPELSLYTFRYPMEGIVYGEVNRNLRD